jgi:hypothetical protein
LPLGVSGGLTMRKTYSKGANDFAGARRVLAALGFAGALVTAILLSLLSSANAASSSVTRTFTYTGGDQVFEVPDGVTSLDVVAVGARGGTSGGGIPGGFGAVASARVAVTPGQILFVAVGGNGAVVSGGFNSGSDGGAGYGPGGGGGGKTDIRTIARGETGSFNSRLILAGGGGGGGGSGGAAPGGVGGQAGQLPSGVGSGGSNGIPSGSGTGGSGGQGGGPVFVSQYFGENSTVWNGSGGGGGGGDQTGSGGKAGTGSGFDGFSTFNDGGGGGGGGGATTFAVTANDRSINTDSTGVPQLRITYTLGGGSGSKSGLKYGKVKLNKSKGTAILPVTVPGSGNLSIGGKGVVHKRPGLFHIARLAKAVDVAGTYKLLVKAKGKNKNKLLSTGKVKVKAVVTFKPTSGDAVHDTRRITLKKD